MKISNFIVHDNGDHSFFLGDDTIYAVAECEKASVVGASLYLISGNIYIDGSSHLIFSNSGVCELCSPDGKIHLDNAAFFICKYYDCVNKKNKGRPKTRKATKYFIKRESWLKDKVCERERKAIIESEMILAYKKNEEPTPLYDFHDGIHFGHNLSHVMLNDFIISNETTKEDVVTFLSAHPQISYSEEPSRITFDNFKLENVNMMVSSINFRDDDVHSLFPKVNFVFFSPIPADNTSTGDSQSVEGLEKFISSFCGGPCLKAKSSLSFLAEWKSSPSEAPNNSNTMFCGWHTRNHKTSPDSAVLFLFGRDLDYRFYAPFYMCFAHDFLRVGDFDKAFEYNYYYYQKEPENLFFIINCLSYCIRSGHKQTQEWYDLAMSLLRDGKNQAITDTRQTYTIVPWAIDERVISTCLQSKKLLDFAEKLTNNLTDFVCRAGILDEAGKPLRNESVMSSWQADHLIKKLHSFAQELKKLGCDVTPLDKKVQDFHAAEKKAAQQDWRSNLYVISEQRDLIDVYFDKHAPINNEEHQSDDDTGDVLVAYDTMAAAINDNPESYPMLITMSEIYDLFEKGYEAIILHSLSGRRVVGREEVQKEIC